VKAPARRLLLGLFLAAVAALAGAALWFTDAAEAWRLRRAPLAELERRAAAGQLDFRGALILGTRLLNAGRYPEAERQLRKLIEHEGGSAGRDPAKGDPICFDCRVRHSRSSSSSW
jgi:hypothetical protein